jgi:acetyl-CoA acetyltransferase
MVAAGLERAPGLDPRDIDDLILGCGPPGGEQGHNTVIAGTAVLADGMTLERAAEVNLDGDNARTSFARFNSTRGGGTAPDGARPRLPSADARGCPG